MDFRQEKQLSNAFNSNMEQVQLVKGIDHPFLLDQLGLDKEQARLTLDDTSISVKRLIIVFPDGNPSLYFLYQRYHHEQFLFGLLKEQILKRPVEVHDFQQIH